MPVNKNRNKNDDWRALVSGSKKQKRKPVSTYARILGYLKFVKIFVILLFVVAICYGAYQLYSSSFFDDLIGSDSDIVTKIEYKTNGVISQRWLQKYIDIKKNTKLSNVDIFGIKNHIKSLSQVKHVEVERIYPDKIKITIEEYLPMARAITTIDSRQTDYILSTMGNFYVPICMNQAYKESLPLITGITLNFNGRTPQDLKSAPKIKEFLAYLQSEMPELKLKSINVAELEHAQNNWDDANVQGYESIIPLFIATTKDDIEIIFAAKDYPKQFERLKYIIKYFSKDNKMDQIKKIDLPLKERADVKLKNQDIK